MELAIIDDNNNKYLLIYVDINHISTLMQASNFTPKPSFTHTTHIGLINIIQIPPKIWIPKQRNLYKPLDYTNDINEVVFYF